MDLANELAHANTVLIPTTMGAVAVTEQAIINEAHERGLVVPNRKAKSTQEDTAAAGAYVAFQRKACIPGLELLILIVCTHLPFVR